MSKLNKENEWIPSNGKKPNLLDGTLVDVKFLDGSTENGRLTSLWYWSQDGEPDDITHYRFHQPVPDNQGKPTPDVTALVDALEGLMRLESRNRIMPVGPEWDAARSALAAYREQRGDL